MQQDILDNMTTVRNSRPTMKISKLEEIITAEFNSSNEGKLRHKGNVSSDEINELKLNLKPRNLVSKKNMRK